ncbi:MAG: glycosyltransferase family protein [Albidovulum sp.]
MRQHRVLMYSHDTFGLGHLRRCRTIANALVENFSGMRVLIISGSQIAGAFDYKSRVDFVKVPSVIKLRNGEYTSLSQHIDLKDTVDLRRRMIRQTAESFQPDIFIVDKEPMGLKGEVEETLGYLRSRGTTLVLGLRDVMDAPHLLAKEWRGNDNLAKIEKYYDRVWVYGPPDFCDPLAGLDVPPSVREKMDFVGFLQRSVNEDVPPQQRSMGDYLLVTTGGGGDGGDLVADVLAAYEHDPGFDQKALIVLGPYMKAELRAEYMERGQRIPQVEIIEFDMHMEGLIAGSRAVVGMGGYNTFCEILSFDKPALIVPRVSPREEQLIRALRAAELGVIDMLHPANARDPAQMLAALRAVAGRKRPSQSAPRVRMEGLPNIVARVAEDLRHREEMARVAASLQVIT